MIKAIKICNNKKELTIETFKNRYIKERKILSM